MATRQFADYTFLVQLYCSSTLTEGGHERFDEAVEEADLAATIHDAVVDALAHALPRSDFDWYEIAVEVK